MRGYLLCIAIGVVFGLAHWLLWDKSIIICIGLGFIISLILADGIRDIWGVVLGLATIVAFGILGCMSYGIGKGLTLIAKNPIPFTVFFALWLVALRFLLERLHQASENTTSLKA